MPFDKRDHSLLWCGLPIGAITSTAADEGFIAFDELTFAAERCLRRNVDHCFAEAMRQKPCGLNGNAEDTGELMGAEALLAGRHQVNSLEPHVQLDVAGFEDSPDFDSERLPAGIAVVDADPSAFALQRPRLINHAAMWADAPCRPQPRFDEGVSCFFAMEMCGRKDGRHGVSP